MTPQQLAQIHARLDNILALHNELRQEFDASQRIVMHPLPEVEDAPSADPLKAAHPFLPHQRPLLPWAPISGGDKVWRNPHGFTVSRGDVPLEIIERWEQGLSLEPESGDILNATNPNQETL